MPDLASTVLSMVRGDSQSFDIALLLKGKPMNVFNQGDGSMISATQFTQQVDAALGSGGS